MCYVSNKRQLAPDNLVGTHPQALFEVIQFVREWVRFFAKLMDDAHLSISCTRALRTEGFTTFECMQ